MITRTSGMSSPDAPLSFNVAGGDALFLGIDFIFWWALVILFESGLEKISFKKGNRPKES